MKIAILGAGMSGVSLYDILKRKYGITVDIYEKEKTIGGLCRTKIIDGYVYDLGGGHIFNSKYNEVKDYVFSLIPEEQWEFSYRKSKILFDDDIVIDYPFEFSLSKLPTNIIVECIESLYTRQLNSGKYNNFHDFLLGTFGEGIFKYYLKPYNEKVWKYDLKEMACDWMEGKMPYPSSEEILTKTLTRDTNESKMVHSSFYYPQKGGIQTLIDSIAMGISKEHIGEKIEKLEVSQNKIYVNGNEYDFVINTIPVPEIADVTNNIPDNVKNAAHDLKYNSMLSFLFSNDRENDWSWLYIPNEKIIPNRTVYLGNFSKFNAPVGKGSSLIEMTGNKEFDTKEILYNIKKYLGVENPIANNYTKYAYVVFDKNRNKNMEVIRNYYENRNIIMHGRFAEWTYPNMDICIKNSMNLAEKISNMQESK